MSLFSTKHRPEWDDQFRECPNETFERKRHSIFMDEVYKALGWQGGTVHQVVAEIKRLRANDDQPS